MDSKITHEILTRFLRNQSTEQEAAWVSEYIHAHPEVLDDYFDMESLVNDPSMEDLKGFTDKRRKKIKKSVFLEVEEHAEKRKILWRWVAAAVTILLIGGSYWLIGYQKKVNIINQVSSVKYRLLENNTAKKMHKVISDGSQITMAPNTKIYVSSSFKNRRAIYMIKGEAGFNVKRDTARPFIVYASGISTMALGTEFRVKEENSGDLVTVCLLSGKVLVQASEPDFKMKDYVLHPGQTLKIEKENNHVQLSEAKKAIAPLPSEKGSPEAHKRSSVHTVWTNAGFEFSKESLANVFDRLENKYQVKIMAEPAMIMHKRFTGKIMNDDSLQNIMQVICDLNDLTVEIHRDSLFIKKK